MPKPFWKLSDEEYVERVRISANRFKAWHKFLAAIYAAIVVACIFITWNALIDDVANLPPNVGRIDVLTAFLVGGLCGALLFSAILSAVLLNVTFWLAKFRARIVLASWDRALELESFIEQHGLTPPSAKLGERE